MQAEAIPSSIAANARELSVLHVVGSAGRYGAEAVIAALAREQTVLGLRVHVVVVSDNLAATASYATELEQECQASVTVVPGKGIRDLFLSKQIAALARKANAGIVHSHGYKSDILCARLQLSGVSKVSTLHGWTHVKPWSRMAIYRRLQIQGLGCFDAVVAVHESVWRQHPALGSLKCQVSIPNGISESGLVPQTKRFEWLPANDAPTILVLGRISAEKGQVVAIEAMRLLKERGLAIRLICAGDGPLLANVRARVANAGMADRVYLPGYVRDVAALMGLADMLLIPSSTEGMPIVLLEALRDGVPVIATSVGGMPSMLGFGRAGHLLAAGSPVQIADAIEGLIANASERERLRREGKIRFEQHYTANLMARRYANLYEQIRTKRHSTLSPAALGAP